MASTSSPASVREPDEVARALGETSELPLPSEQRPCMMWPNLAAGARGDEGGSPVSGSERGGVKCRMEWRVYRWPVPWALAHARCAVCARAAAAAAAARYCHWLRYWHWWWWWDHTDLLVEEGDDVVVPQQRGCRPGRRGVAHHAIDGRLLAVTLEQVEDGGGRTCPRGCRSR